MLSSDSISSTVDLNKSTPYANTKSMEMDGVGDYFHPGFTQAQKETFFRDSFTISFWGKFNFSNNGWYGFGFQSSSGNATMRMLMINLGGPYGAWYVDGVFNSQGWNSGFQITTNHAGDKLAWLHIALVIEKGASSSDNNKFFLYENGSLLSSGASFTSNAATNADMSVADFTGNPDIAFGAAHSADSGTSTAADMRLDEVAFFDTALDATTIAAIYNSGNTFDLTSANGDYKSQANLVRYYRLEDNLTDSTGTSDGGTEGDPVFSSDTPDS